MYKIEKVYIKCEECGLVLEKDICRQLDYNSEKFRKPDYYRVGREIELLGWEKVKWWDFNRHEGEDCWFCPEHKGGKG